MTQFYQYRSALRAASAWTVALGNNEVRLGTLSLTTLAEHLQAGTSSIILDDPDADLGHSGDHILGLHRFELIETDAADDEHVVITFIGQRTYRRGDTERPSLRTGAQRQIELQLIDLNCIPTFRVIDPDDADAKRPSETVNARIAWALGSDYMLNAVADDGLVESNTTVMDAAEYGGQTMANVIGDCEIAAGFGWNAWIYYTEGAGHYSLGFINANTSTAYSSSVRISNVLADLDTTTAASFLTGTTFAPSYDAELTRDPANIVSGVHVPYADNHLFRERQATEDIYGPREQSAPNSNVKTVARAAAIAEDYLFQHSTDDDHIHVAIEVPTSKANAIKAGQRLQVKFSHLPGYTSFTWCRVIRRTIIQEEATDRYIIDMDLSPQEAAAPVSPCSSGATTDGTYYPLGGNNTTSFSNPSDGVVHYWRAGLEYPWTDDLDAGAWHFPQYGAGGVGSIDYAGDCANNRLIFTVIGNGTMTIQTEMYFGSPRTLAVENRSVVLETFTSGDSVEIVIDDRTDGDCVTLIEVRDTGAACGGKWGWSQMTWVGA